MKYLPLALAALILAGCATPPVARMAFPEAEYAALPKTGTGTVKGQAFMKTRGGDVKTAAGNTVMLNPVTSYSIEWYEKSYLTGKKITQADSRINPHCIVKTADAGGNFTFKNVPPGEYFITTVVFWEAPTGYQGSLMQQGGNISKRIKVINEEETEVILSR